MKRIISGLLAAVLTLCLLQTCIPAAQAGDIILSAGQVSGKRFTQDADIAAKLDRMFAGDIGLYREIGCKNPVNAALGTSNVPNNGVQQYWRYTSGIASGTSCYAYANAFYGSFYDGIHPHYTPSENHTFLRDPRGNISYESFLRWGVREDAAVYIRVGNHSVIVLAYDRDAITYVDGNGNGAGLIALRREPWQRTTGGAAIYTGTVSLIVQPSEGYFPAGIMNTSVEQYPAYVRGVTADGAVLRQQPGGAVIASLPAESVFTATALVKYGRDQYWYRGSAGEAAGYLYAGDLREQMLLTEGNGIFGTRQMAPQIPKGKGYPVNWEVNTEVLEITGLCGGIYRENAPVCLREQSIPGTQHASFQGEIDRALAFGTLPEGEYALVLTAELTGYFSEDGTTLEKYTDKAEKRWTFAVMGEKTPAGWVQSAGKWYYYTPDGTKKTGWLLDGKTWYYLGDDGAMVTGDMEIDGRVNRFSASGAWQGYAPARNGWVAENSRWYFYRNDRRVTGWLLDRKTWYYLGADGAMAVGWLETGGKRYYLASSGAMRTGWVLIGNQWYCFAPDGAMRTGWFLDGRVWYWLDPETGVMATGSCMTEGRLSRFSASGAWLGYAD